MIPRQILNNSHYLLLIALLLLMTVLSAQATTLSQSVEQALLSNPQLQALTYNQRAIEYDLKQAKGGYLPSLDLLLGYGYGQFSEDDSGSFSSDPDDNDWKSRSNATIRLVQKVYDGGETGNQVSIRKAQLNSADHWTKATAQAVALETISAHLSVFQQRELISLAKKNLQIHRNIYASLAEREQAGAGNIADVTQAQARLARAESTLYLSQADLSRTIAKYTQVAGSPPQELTYAADPRTLPGDLTTILQRLEKHNPELLAVTAEMAEAGSRLALARVNYKPKIDLELSSRYTDHMDGNDSWQNSNAAMLNLRWNLFNGGQDKAGIGAALFRKNQSRSKRAAKLAELTEEAATAWANYASLQRQKTAYFDAVEFSRKTFEAYLIQFAYSQRSLLDVLSAENEYFQSAVQLIRVDINATLTAYHLLALSGNIQPSYGTDAVPEYYHELTQSLPMAGAN
ncbi:MAG: TolC family outer membrane protein [Desulfuromusa sp.]|nr:TolC family outer membrane protein [Desulfuromusa sp.]